MTDISTDKPGEYNDQTSYETWVLPTLSDKERAAYYKGRELQYIADLTARPSSAPSVAIERVKAWFYSKPRKQAQAAFTAGDERQIAYMLEDAEAKVLLANQAKAVVAMNSAAQSARGTKFDAARYYKEYRDGLYGDGWQRDETTSHEHVDSLEATVNAALNLHGGHLIVPTDDRAARTEEVPKLLIYHCQYCGRENTERLDGPSNKPEGK